MSIKVAVGQEVAVESGRYHLTVSFGWTVKRITARGDIVVEKVLRDGAGGKVVEVENIRFDKDGRNKKGQVLITDVAAERARTAQEAARRRAAVAIERVCVDRSLGTYSKSTLQTQVEELRMLLDAAAAAVAAIPDDVP